MEVLCERRCSHGIQLRQCGHLIVDVEKLQAAASSPERHRIAVTYVVLCTLKLQRARLSFRSYAGIILILSKTSGLSEVKCTHLSAILCFT